MRRRCARPSLPNFSEWNRLAPRKELLERIEAKLPSVTARHPAGAAGRLIAGNQLDVPPVELVGLIERVLAADLRQAVQMVDRGRLISS